MLLGDKKSCAIEFLGFSGGLTMAELYVAGQQVTITDNAHYHLVGSLKESARIFAETDKWLYTERDLPGFSPDERLQAVLKSERRFDHQVFDWGPPTDDVFAMVIPFSGALILCVHFYESGQNHHIEIKAQDLADTLLAAAKHISKQWNVHKRSYQRL